MDSAEMLAYGLMLLCCAGLGITIVIEAARLLFAGTAIAEVSVRISARTAALDGVQKRLQNSVGETRRCQAEANRLNLEHGRLETQIKGLMADKVEIVHEIGAPDGGAALFACELIPVASFSQMVPRQIIFSRDIWRYRNVVHIWADNVENARAQINRLVSTRRSVGIGRIRLLDPAELAVPLPVGGAQNAGGAFVPRRPATGALAAE